MKRKATDYELLLFPGSRFSKKHICPKSCNRENRACPFNMHRALQMADSILKLFPVEPACHAAGPMPVMEIIPFTNFIGIKTFMVPGNDEWSINPHSSLPVTNFN